MPQNAANQELESNLKLLHQKYEQYHKVEITMRYLSNLVPRAFPLKVGGALPPLPPSREKPWERGWYLSRVLAFICTISYFFNFIFWLL